MQILRSSLKENTFIFFFLLIFFQDSMYSKTSSRTYQYQVAACLMFYNEAYFLKEWLEYHKLIGIEHFYLFNNGSIDNYMEILEPYVNSGEVELYHYPERGENQQTHTYIQCNIIYNQALALAKGKAKWLAIIDADEFIYPVKKGKLSSILKKYHNIGGLYINYLFFGTSYINKISEDDLIIESLTRCANKPLQLGKSIVRPERVSHSTDPHRMWYIPPYTHINTRYENFDWLPDKVAEDTLLLFHYYTGDIDHAMTVTLPRRQRWMGYQAGTYLQSVDYMNAISNDSMARFIPALRKKMGLTSKN